MNLNFSIIRGLTICNLFFLFTICSTWYQVERKILAFKTGYLFQLVFPILPNFITKWIYDKLRQKCFLSEVMKLDIFYVHHTVKYKLQNILVGLKRHSEWVLNCFNWCLRMIAIFIFKWRIFIIYQDLLTTLANYK